jgi:tetratricopeptide (TPR) repeat protein
MSLAALNNIGISQMETGENRAAVDTFTQVLREAEELDARHAQASALTNLGQAHLALADYEIAASSARRALAIHRELGRRREQALALGVLGLVQRETGDPAAEASFAETLLICRETGDRLSEAETLNNMAEMPGPAQTQRAYASEALAIARDIAARQEEARALGLIGLSYLAAADTAEAARLLRESLALYQQVDVPVPDRIRQALRTSLCTFYPFCSWPSPDRPDFPVSRHQKLRTLPGEPGRTAASGPSANWVPGRALSPFSWPFHHFPCRIPGQMPCLLTGTGERAGKVVKGPPEHRRPTRECAPW